jgi:hypothetical protein
MIRLIFYWIAILFLQLVVFNHLGFTSHLAPQVFIILLITLPLHISKSYQMLLGFLVGLVADLFIGTPGIHASACMWLIMLRFFLLGAQDLKEQIANHLPYNIHSVGLSTFAATATSLVLFYHLYVFWLESIGAINWIFILLTTLLSSLFTLIVIGAVQLLSDKSSGEF